MKAVSLGELERQVMDIIWEHKHCSARDILIKLEKNRRLAYTTIATILQRLYGKGLVKRNEDKVGYVYAPKVSRERFIAKYVHNIFATAVSTLGQEAVTYFVKEIQKMSPKKRKDLLKMLD